MKKKKSSHYCVLSWLAKILGGRLIYLTFIYLHIRFKEVYYDRKGDSTSFKWIFKFYFIGRVGKLLFIFIVYSTFSLCSNSNKLKFSVKIKEKNINKIELINQNESWQLYLSAQIHLLTMNWRILLSRAEHSAQNQDGAVIL